MSANVMDEKIKRIVEQFLAERDEALPVWIRAPKPGEHEHYSGLGRGKLYALDAAGHIKSACLKPPGAVRGVRLFNLRSILEYVDSCATASSHSVPPEHPATSLGAIGPANGNLG